jgi:hypothetical protein
VSKFLQSSLIIALIPVMRVKPSWPNSSPKGTTCWYYCFGD